MRIHSSISFYWRRRPDGSNFDALEAKTVDDQKKLDCAKHTLVLRGRDLAGDIFSGADFRKADFEGAHLERASLSDAWLQGALLSGAHLQDASLNGAHLQDASLNGAHLQDAAHTLRAHGLTARCFASSSSHRP